MMSTKQGALRLVLMAGASLLITGQAAAQTANAPTSEETVTIVGRRPLAESQAAALKVQRNSDSLVSVLSADAIGDLPDQNIAQAVSRLPGVGIERDQGQGRYLNLRGAPIYWTTLSFDGMSVVSPEGRQTRFDNIPSAIASQVTVQKAIVPSMPGDTVAGNVDIRTRRAFDYKGQKITGKLGLGHVELGKGQEIDSSLVYSNIFMGGKLGLVGQASYYSREMATENWETDPYLTNTTAPTKRFAQVTKNKHYRLTRENYSFSLRADYKLSDNHTLFASTINSVYHDDELRDQFLFDLDQGKDAAGKGYTSATFIDGNDPKFGTVYSARVNARITYRDNYDSMTTNTIGGEHRFDNELQASWRLNYTWTDNTGNNPAEVRFRSGSTITKRPTIDYNFRDNTSNFVTLYRTTGTSTALAKGAQVQNIEDFDMPNYQITSGGATELTSAYTAKADFDYPMPLFGRDSKVEFGGLFTTRTKQNKEFTITGVADSTMQYGALAQDGAYLGKQYLGYTFRYSNKDAVLAKVASASAGVAKVPTDSNYYKVNEKISAAYLMATTDFDFGNIVYGVRAEQISNTGEAIATVNGAKTPIEVKSSETLLYPSAHLNWNLTSNLKARIGLTTSASRADFDDLRPNLVIDDTNDTVSGGNPFAKPEKQTGLDAYLEYYGANDSFWSIGAYRKNIKDVLFSQTVTVGNNSLDSNGIDRSAYAYTTVVNAGDGYLQGIEAFYSGTIENFAEEHSLPQWVEGFGVRASATFTNSEVNIPAVGASPARKTVLSGTSDSVYNVQAIYEKYGLTVRLAAQFRTPWLQSVGAYKTVSGAVIADGNGDIYWDSDPELDFSTRYQLNNHVELFFDAVNLTNDGAPRYADGDQYPIEYEKFGKRYIAGARFNF